MGGNFDAYNPGGNSLSGINNGWSHLVYCIPPDNTLATKPDDGDQVIVGVSRRDKKR